jgi:hypothetical protein
MAQYARPNSDINVGGTSGWYESVGASQTNIYTALDETSDATSDYIYSSANQLSDGTLGLSTVTDPEKSNGHILRYTLRRSITNKAYACTIYLYDGTNEIGSWAHPDPMPGTYTSFARTLDSTAADAISDYSNLAVRYQVTQASGGGGSVEVTFTELEVPSPSQTYDETMDLGLHSAGAAVYGVTQEETPTKGTHAAGESDESFSDLIEIGGIAEARGNAEVTLYDNVEVGGGLESDGTSEPAAIYNVEVGGGLEANGAGEPSVIYNPVSKLGGYVAAIKDPSANKQPSPTAGINPQSSQLEDLVGWWPMTPPGGSEVYDRLTGNTATISGDAEDMWVADSGRWALYFDGTNELDIPSTGYQDVSSAYTISFWVKPDSVSGTQSIIYRGANESTNDLNIEIDGGKLKASHNNNNGGNGPATLTTFVDFPAEWSQVVVSYDKDGAWTAHISGTYDTLAAVVQPIGDSSPVTGGNWKIGGSTGGFKGKISDLRIYKKPKKEKKITESYSNQYDLWDTQALTVLALDKANNLLGGGEATVSQTSGGNVYNETMSGGVEVAGETPPQTIKEAEASGGAVIYTLEDLYNTEYQVAFNPESSGGVEVAGDADDYWYDFFEPSGGVELAGAADEWKEGTYNEIAEGGIHTGGGADLSLISTFVTTGGVKLNGSSTASTITSESSSGGMETNGSATAAQAYEVAVDPGLEVAGSAEVSSSLGAPQDEAYGFILPAPRAQPGRKPSCKPNTMSNQYKGLVAWWSCDYANGNTLYDLAGGHHGALQSATADDTWVVDNEGRGGHAVQFDEINNGYFQVPDSPELELTEFTISFWLSSSEPLEKIILQKDGFDGYSVRTVGTVNSSEIELTVGGDGNCFQTFNNWTDGDGWHLITFVYRGVNDAVVYVDGIDDTDTGRGVSVGTPSYGNGPLYIGGDGTDDSLVGKVDDIRIYNRQLSQAEVQELWNPQTRYELWTEPESVIVGGEGVATGVKVGGTAEVTEENTFNETMSGGIELAGTASQTLYDVVEVGGGVEIAGLSIVEKGGTYNETMDGGLEAAGLSDVAKNSTYNETMDGAVEVSGDADDYWYDFFEPSGGVELAGLSDVEKSGSYDETMSGGIELAGAARLTFNDVVEVGGGVEIAGLSDVTKSGTFDETMSGGIELAGTAKDTLNDVVEVGGGVELAGTAEDSFSDVVEVGGGVELAGLSIVEKTGTFDETMEGGVEANGGDTEQGVYTHEPVVQEWAFPIPSLRSQPNRKPASQVNKASQQYNGLVAWWGGSETGTEFLYDKVHGSHGTLTNHEPDTDWVTDTDRGGFVLSFDGDNEYVELGSITSCHPLMLNGSDVTISAWFYQLDGSGDIFQRIIDKSTNGSGVDGYTLWCHPTDRTVGLSCNGANFGGTYATQSNQYEFATWHHLVGVITASAFHLYVDGVEVTATLGSGPSGDYQQPPNTTANMRIGSWNHTTGREWDGRLDDIRIYNRVLTVPEIQYLYNPQTRYELWSEPEIATLATQEASYGVEVGGAALIPFASYDETMDGGLEAAGQTDPQCIYQIDPTGVAELAGEAEVSEEGEYNEVMSGGIEVAGQTSPKATYNPSATDGAELAGVAEISGGLYNVTMDGGVEVNGAATIHLQYTATDGVVIGGEADTTTETSYDETMEGGVEINGQAIREIIYDLLGSGGAEIAGESTVSSGATYDEAMEGGVEANGASQNTVERTLEPSGGILVDGEAGISLFDYVEVFGGVIVGGQMGDRWILEIPSGGVEVGGKGGKVYEHESEGGVIAGGESPNLRIFPRTMDGGVVIPITYAKVEQEQSICNVCRPSRVLDLNELNWLDQEIFIAEVEEKTESGALKWDSVHGLIHFQATELPYDYILVRTQFGVTFDVYEDSVPVNILKGTFNSETHERVQYLFDQVEAIVKDERKLGDALTKIQDFGDCRLI